MSRLSLVKAIAVTALVIAPLSASGCGGHTSPHCGNETISVALPDAGDVTSATFTTDNSSCAAHAGSTSYVNVTRFSAGTCQVQVVFPNGATYSFSVEFAANATGRCQGAIGVSDASSPVLIDAGPCVPSGGTPGTSGAAGSSGSSGAAGTGGTTFSPACAGLTTAGGVPPIRACGCTATDPQLCYKPCGVEGQGAKSETCTGGVYVEAVLCAFDPAKDYSCYKLPPDSSRTGNPTCPAQPPRESAACTVDHCVVCNSSGGLPGGVYIDRGGFVPTGYCVCSLPDPAGNRTWNCDGIDQWPCPDASGC